MSTEILTIPSAQGTALFPMGKDASRSYTHALPESPLLSSHYSDIIELSPAARKRQENEEKSRELLTSDDKSEKSSNGRKLTREEQKEVEKIERIDREVKRREIAHRAVAGNYARGSISFEYVTGPDGKKYAVEGHITIDARPILNNPEASIRKAQSIKNAKLESSDASLDRSLYAEVAKMEREARMKLKTDQKEESDDTNIADNPEDLFLNYKNPFNPVENELYVLA